MIVVDTNIIAHYYIRSEKSDILDALLEADEEWIAPNLWKSEFKSVLALQYRHQLISFEQAITLYDKAHWHLNDRSFEVDKNTQFMLIASSSCSSYDCEFIALAKDLDLPLLTFDKKILREFPNIAIIPQEFLN